MNRILLIEDEPTLLDMYQRLFISSGFEVKTAKDGASGLQIVKESGADIILLDIMMPSMNGLDVLQELKSDTATKKIPVLVLTNIDNPKEMSAANLLGAADYLVKSNFEPSEIVVKVKEVLANKNS